MLIVNASPLIVLAKSGLLEILPQLASEVVCPRQAFDEVLAKPEDVIVSGTIAVSPWLQVVEGVVVSTGVAALDLGDGEASVISLALLARSAEAVLDDAAARRAAGAMGVSVVGSLGLIVRAERLGLIPSAWAAVNMLIESGLYVSPKLLSALQQELDR